MAMIDAMLVRPLLLIACWSAWAGAADGPSRSPAPIPAPVPAATTPPASDWLDRQDRLARLVDVMHRYGLNPATDDPAVLAEMKAKLDQVASDVRDATTEHPADPAAAGMVDSLRSSIAAVRREVDDRDPDKAERGGPAPRPSPLRASRSTDGCLFLYWSFRAPEADTLFPALVRMRLTMPDLPVYHIHLEPPSEWQQVMLDLSQAEAGVDMLRRRGSSDAEIDAFRRQSMEPIMAVAKPVMAAQAFDGSLGIAPFRSVAAAVVHRAVRIPTWRYRSKHGITHALTGSGPSLDLAAWITGIETWETGVAAEAAAAGIPFSEAVAAAATAGRPIDGR